MGPSNVRPEGWFRRHPPDALVLPFMMAICSRYLNKALSFYFARDLHHAAAGRVPPHRFSEKGLDMTKIIDPPYVMSMADRVTYGMVAGIVVLGVLAFVFLQ